MIELLILYVLLKKDLTMYGIRKQITELFSAYTSPSFGAIKPALVRLEKQNCISLTKIMSDGGKLSIYYSLKNDGIRFLKDLLLKPLSSNALQFMSDSRVKLSCSDVLTEHEKFELYTDIKTNALLHKSAATKLLEDDYTSKTTYQKIVLDNVICEYQNLISLVEGLEKQ